MIAASSGEGANLLKRLTAPVVLAVSLVVAAAWYVTWSTSDVSMSLLMEPAGLAGPGTVALFFTLLVAMMVAMMLPAALPMILTFHAMRRSRSGPGRPADGAATALFVAPYFLVWGAFGLLALLGIATFGLLGPLTGALALLPAAVLLAAGAWQVTRTKAVCLRHCQSPVGFVLHHGRPGRSGAFRMGLHHATYCIGCCWLFMLVLFVSGAMSLAWMGGLSIAILAEKVGPRTTLVSRVIGVLLIALGAVLAVRAV